MREARRRPVGNRIVVLFRGKPMEIGWASQVYSLPLHRYTETLLSADAQRPALTPHPPGLAAGQ